MVLKPIILNDKIMWNDFKLTISDPSTVKRVGKMDLLLDIAEKIEGVAWFEDGSYLAMSAHYTTDSSYTRLNGFLFPLCVRIQRLMGQTTKVTVSTAQFSFWKRESDSRSLVMFGFSNAPENNFEGSYEEALAWIVGKIKE